MGNPEGPLSFPFLTYCLLFKYYHNFQIKTISLPLPLSLLHTHTYTHTVREYGLSCIADGSVRAQTPTEGNSDTHYQNDKYKYFSTQKVTLENLFYRLTHTHVIHICTRLFTADLLKWQNGDKTKHLINRESSLDKLWYKHRM